MEPEMKSNFRSTSALIISLCVIGVVLFYLFKLDSGEQHRSTSDEIRDIKELVLQQTIKIDSLKASEVKTIEKIHTEKNHYYEKITTRDAKIKEVRAYSDDDAVKYFHAYINEVARANDSINNSR